MVKLKCMLWAREISAFKLWDAIIIKIVKKMPRNLITLADKCLFVVLFSHINNFLFKTTFPSSFTDLVELSCVK